MKVLPARRCGRRCCQPACTDRTSIPDPPETSLDSQLFFVFFLSTRLQNIKLAHVGMGKAFVHKCCIQFCTSSIHNIKYLQKTDLFFTSSMVGLRENGVFLYTASKILAFTWLLSIWIYLRFLNMSYVMISYQYIDNDETFITDCHTCDIESQSRTRTTTSSSSSSCLKESLFWSNIVSDNPNEDNNNKREPSSSSCLKESRIWSNYDDAEHNEDNENKREPATWTTQQAIVEAATASL